LTVPAGFSTDLGSVPRWMTWLVPIQGVWDRATIIHDYLCVALQKVWEGEQDRAYLTGANARDTDAILRRICRELGVPLVRRWLAWTGVRWGALFNPARRAGWWRDAPAVLAISLLALPVIAPATVAVLLALAVDSAVEAVVSRWAR